MTRYNGQAQRQLRLAHGWSPQRMASHYCAVTGETIAYNTITSYETGRTSPTITIAGRIAETLGVQLADLISTDK